MWITIQIMNTVTSYPRAIMYTSFAIPRANSMAMITKPGLSRALVCAKQRLAPRR